MSTVSPPNQGPNPRNHYGADDNGDDDVLWSSLSDSAESVCFVKCGPANAAYAQSNIETSSEGALILDFVLDHAQQL